MPVATSPEYGEYVAPNGTAAHRIRLEVAAVRALIDEIERSASEADPRSESSLEAQLLEQLNALVRAIGGAAPPKRERRGRLGGFCGGSESERVVLSQHPHERGPQTVTPHSDIHTCIEYSTFTIEDSGLKGKGMHK
jgi:hypothetical protein